MLYVLAPIYFEFEIDETIIFFICPLVREGYSNTLMRKHISGGLEQGYKISISRHQDQCISSILDKQLERNCRDGRVRLFFFMAELLRLTIGTGVGLSFEMRHVSDDTHVAETLQVCLMPQDGIWIIDQPVRCERGEIVYLF